MSSLMRRCPRCLTYTFEEKCPSCGAKTESPHPPKYTRPKIRMEGTSRAPMGSPGGRRESS